MAKLEHKPVIDWDCDIQDISGTKWVSKDEAEAAIKKLNDSTGNGWLVAALMGMGMVWTIIYFISRH